MKHSAGGRAPSGNPLVPVVEPFGPFGRQALWEAAARGNLQRRSWDGCALNCAAAMAGTPAWSYWVAAKTLHIRWRTAYRFVRVWDHLPGSDADCTRMLLDALTAVGFRPAVGAGESGAAGAWERLGAERDENRELVSV